MGVLALCAVNAVSITLSARCADAVHVSHLGCVCRSLRVFRFAIRCFVVRSLADCRHLPLAAFHKLNHDFLNPEFSCAHHALRQMDAYWSLIPFPTGLGVSLSIAVVVIEILICILLLRRSLWFGLSVQCFIGD